MTGLQGRVSRILVASAPGAEARVRAALGRLAAGRLTVAGVGYDETLFAKIAAASNQSTELFAVISALVGFLFAFNAMLLTVPQRRRLIADLRRDGYTPRTVIGVLLLDAVVLGLIACVLGLALGDELSIHVLHSDPAFLSLAFAIGSERVVSWQSVVIATGGGMLAAIVAVLSPLRDILSRDPLAAIRPRHDRGGARADAGTRRRRPAGARERGLSRYGHRDPARQDGRRDPGNGAARSGSAAGAAVRAEHYADARQAVRGHDHQRGSARRGDGAERGARAGRGDRGDGRDRGVRQRHDPGSARRPAQRPRKRHARTERLHGRMGRPRRLLQPARHDPVRGERGRPNSNSCRACERWACTAAGC